MKRLLVVAVAVSTWTLLAQGPQSSKNTIGMEFVPVSPGEFMMGCSKDDDQCSPDEKPAHRVQITKAFEIGKYEVTQAQWQSVMGSNPSAMKSDDRPVENVNKDETHDFLSRLNAKNDGYRYRLPTEAEWEYAARAGTTGPYAGALDEIAWYSGNSEDETHPVGKKKPNAWGLYDMQGNVREWVEDLYGRNYYGNSPAVDPAGPPAGQRGGGPPPRGGFPGRGPRGQRGPRGGPPDGPRGVPPDGQRGQRGQRGGPGQLPVMRGGAWDNLESFLRVSSRYNYYGPTLRVSDLGFRVVREALPR